MGAAARRDKDVKGADITTAAKPIGMAFVLVAALTAFATDGARAAGIGGVVADQPTGAVSPRARPALSPDLLDYNGGPVMHTNSTHVIFWAPSNRPLSFDPGYKQQVIGFLQNVAADSHKSTNVYSVSGQYYDGPSPSDPAAHSQYDSTFAGALDDTDPVPASNTCTLPPPPALGSTGPTMPDGVTGWPVCVSGAVLKNEVVSFVTAHSLPTGLGDLYFVVTPDGFGTCFDGTHSPNNCSLGGSGVQGAPVTGSFCGFHTSADSSTAPVIHILYADMPYTAVPGHCVSGSPRPNGSTADPTMSVISHEHNEAITDPLPGPGTAAWQNPGDIENGDLCATNFGPTLGGTGSTSYNEVIGSGHYFLQEEWSNDDNACIAREESNAPSFSSTAPRPAGVPIVFTGSASDPDGAIGAIVSLSWNFGDGSPPAIGTPVTHTYASNGIYQVTVTSTDITGQRDSQTRQVIVDTPPSASFSNAPRAPVARQSVRFDGRRSTDADGSIASYRWNFGDGTPDFSGATVAHSFAHGGKFTVLLEVTDNLGVGSTRIRSITVAPLPHVSTSLKGRSLSVSVNEAGTLTVGSKRKRLKTAGRATFGLGLSPGQLAALRAGRPVSLKLTITFVPRIGPRLTRKITITVRH